MNCVADTVLCVAFRVGKISQHSKPHILVHKNRLYFTAFKVSCVSLKAMCHDLYLRLLMNKQLKLVNL